MGKLRVEAKLDKAITKRMLSDFRRYRRYVRNRNGHMFIRKNDRDMFNTYIRTVSLLTDKEYDRISFTKSRMTNQEFHFILDQVVVDLETAFKRSFA